jgi:hypothetical protein
MHGIRVAITRATAATGKVLLPVRLATSRAK